MDGLPRLPARDRDAHKGAFGRVLIVAGSRGMSGAAALAGKAALRGGAGLVRVAAPEQCVDTVASLEPCYTTIPLPGDPHGRLSLAAAEPLAGEVEQADAVALGPGLGRSPQLDQLVRQLYGSLPRPLVVDADGLNALAGAVPGSPPAPRLLTPHPGEFRRLSGLEPAQQRSRAAAWAGRHQCVLLLKGRGTLITDGEREATNATGNPGMATGGTGDVLTGVIVALIGQGLAPWDAARLAAHVHGLAGDLAAMHRGETAMIASDLLEFLPEAFRSLS